MTSTAVSVFFAMQSFYTYNADNKEENRESEKFMCDRSNCDQKDK